MGRPEFETVVAQAPRKKVLFQDLSNSTPLAITAFESVYIYPPAGHICTLNLFHLIVTKAPGATAGTIDADLALSTAGYPNYLHGSSMFGDDLIFRDFFWESATRFKKPPTNEALAVKSFMFDSVNGLRINIQNLTDVNIAAGAITKNIMVQYTQEQIAI